MQNKKSKTKSKKRKRKKKSVQLHLNLADITVRRYLIDQVILIWGHCSCCYIWSCECHGLIYKRKKSGHKSAIWTIL